MPLLAVGLAACSFSFKAGGGGDKATAKPAQSSGDATPTTGSKGKPINPGQEPAEPEAEQPEASDPERLPPASDDPPPPERLAPTVTTAVCRVSNKTQAQLCHTVLDPVAANDLDAWMAVVSDDIVLTHPSHQKGGQRYTGPQAIADAATQLGGLRALLHINSTDRIVATVSGECQSCSEPFVAYQLNTRSGTVVVRVRASNSPRVTEVEVASEVRRPTLTAADQKPPRAEDKPARAEKKPDPAEKKSAPALLKN